MHSKEQGFCKMIQMNIWKIVYLTHWYLWHDWSSQLYKQLKKKTFRPERDSKPLFLGFSERSHQLLKMVEGCKELKFNISISNRLPFFEQLSNIDPNKGCSGQVVVMFVCLSVLKSCCLFLLLWRDCVVYGSGPSLFFHLPFFSEGRNLYALNCVI